MKSGIRGTIQNTPAMNTLMAAILLVGAVSLVYIRRDLFPDFELEIISITVPYPGASPDEVEEGICQKIEEAVQSIDGIEKMTAVAREGTGSVVLELESDVPDVQKTLGEVRSEVDRIISFPLLAEDPEVKQVTIRRGAIRVGVIGPDTDAPDAELKLRELAEEVRNDLLHLPLVTQAELVGVKDYQIDIEIDEDTLRKYGLTLQQVARIVRRENLELPGGNIKTDAQEVLLRGKNRRLVGPEIAKIPLVTRPGGVVLTVGDLGRVRDEFTDTTAVNRVNGKPAMVISVEKTASEDLLAITEEVKDYLATKQLPRGYQLMSWDDRSTVVRARLELLGRNGLQGIILVFLVLAVFLEMRLAFWVALGVPISMLGAFIVLLAADQTLNMLSMFAFLVALGILVDDAIVIGENVYAHRGRGKSFAEAAVDGTCEVLPSVAASVTTTIMAFVPMFFVPGVMGKFLVIMPLAVITMLIISLVEVTFILPCHLAHERKQPTDQESGAVVSIRRWGRLLPTPVRLMLIAPLIVVATLLAGMFYPLRRIGDLFQWINGQSTRGLHWVIDRVYLPLLRRSLENPAVVLSLAATILLLSLGLIRAGVTPFVAFPKLDSLSIAATLIYPDGTPSKVTEEATSRLERAIWQVNEKYAKRGMPVVVLTHRTAGHEPPSDRHGAGIGGSVGGSHIGGVAVELVETSLRDIDSQHIIAEWRKQSGDFPGVESLSFGANMGPGAIPIEFQFLADARHMDALEDVVQKCKTKLAAYPGVFDIADNCQPGKWEFQLRVKDKARAMGIPMADLAETVRASYYGDEVMRLQRGRHEVKLMVRYPHDQRRSLADFDDINVRTGNGAERPLTELAQVEVLRGYSEINRLDQLRAITITADVEESEGNAREIVTDLKNNFLPKLLEDPKYSGVRVRWEGQQEQTTESLVGLLQGLAVALVAMFALLTLEFRSYFQPFLILAIIPFGAVGAIGGHVVMGLPVTLFSLFGMVALSGVVINDSIVLIDFINRRVRDGMPVRAALLDAGRRRFRPVMLTSVTTVAGLLPLLTETSFQAQMLIPMATSLCFGLMFATVLVLVLVPTFYLLHARLTGAELKGEGREARGEGRGMEEDAIQTPAAS